MDIFSLLAFIWSKLIYAMESVSIFGTNLWNFNLGMSALLIASKAMRLMFGYGDDKRDKK